MPGKFRFHQKSNGLFCSSSIHLPPENSVIKALGVLWMWVRRKEKRKFGDGKQGLKFWIPELLYSSLEHFWPLPSHAQVWLHPVPSEVLSLIPSPPSQDTHHFQNIADNPPPPGSLPWLHYPSWSPLHISSPPHNFGVSRQDFSAKPSRASGLLRQAARCPVCLRAPKPDERNRKEEGFGTDRLSEHSNMRRLKKKGRRELGYSNLWWGKVLLYQTWVHSPCTIKPIYWHRVVVKESTVFIAGRQARSSGQLVLKTPKLPMGFRKAILKARWGRGVPGCVISSCTILWLVDGEVTGQSHRG